MQTASPWQQAEEHLRSTQAVLDSPDDAAAQAHLAAFGDLLYGTAMAAPAARAEIHAAATAFDRARRSGIRADQQRAAALRSATKELLGNKSASEGTVVIDLLVAAVYVAVAAARWHEQRGHEQQAAAAEQSLIHLRTAYDAAAQPALADLARRAPRQRNTDRYEAAVRESLPDHAEHVLADPAWPALTTVLARAESAGHRPGQILTQAASERELGTARSAAEVLTWRIKNTPSRRANAATARTPGTIRSAADVTDRPAVQRHAVERGQRPRR